MEPIVHGLQQTYGNQIRFTRINILNPDNHELMEQYGFSSTPEFYLLDGQGIILQGWSDSFTLAEVQAAFEHWLAQPLAATPGAP